MGTLLAAKGDPKLNGCFICDKEFPVAERLCAKEAEIQEQLRIHRQILYDLAVHYLEPLNGSFARLAYLASLRNASDGSYAHERLAALYGAAAVGEALANCHEELFERLLEQPLAQQEKDLRSFVRTLPEGAQEGLKLCKGRMEDWIPLAAPDYLKELFRSNLTALLELLRGENPKVD
ncbi:MAG TPA: hypothetical protein VFI45_11785 [Candidatus Acidoferrum sp.]|nr:hypothetical protein [Candidatus Acidoferrum sp.]